MNKEVLQKYIASSGLCSRRKAEVFIKEKQVKLNGKMASLGDRAGSKDKVEVVGKTIKKEKEKIYIKLNKPRGFTCTNREFKGEQNIFKLINNKERLFVVGRLDKNSRGLVLLTNDGEFAQKLTHPKHEHEKEYIVKVENKKKKDLVKREVAETTKSFKKGVDINDSDGIVSAKRIKYLGDNKFSVVLTQGKKRQIRRMFDVLGIEVVDLLRIRIGKIALGDLKEGDSLQFLI